MFINLFFEMFQKNSSKVIFQFSSNKVNLKISDKRKILEAEMKSKVQTLKFQTKKLFQTLISNLNANDIKLETIEFLGSLLHDYEFPISNFLYLFEINSQLFSFWLIKFLFSELYQSLGLNFQIELKKELFEQNCFIVGSLMYQIIMDLLKSQWFSKLGNQSNLLSKYQTYPRPLGPLLSDNYQQPKDVAEVRQIIHSHDIILQTYLLNLLLLILNRQTSSVMIIMFHYLFLFKARFGLIQIKK
ncbi:unnamed protein product [Paramecium pentaurelia]|uniref:Transmembrane protein n=1 Tax=Paramecium pentaurelia TaxID=43138 RepID=A0A8S1VTQ1_9CILI|nr:unnamed protein product [Paramecium pentaurelia]